LRKRRQGELKRFGAKCIEFWGEVAAALRSVKSLRVNGQPGCRLSFSGVGEFDTPEGGYPGGAENEEPRPPRHG